MMTQHLAVIGTSMSQGRQAVAKMALRAFSLFAGDMLATAKV